MTPAMQIKRIEQLLSTYRKGIISLVEFRDEVEKTVEVPTSPAKPKVVCDASNNPPEVVAANQLVVDVTLPRPMPPKLKPITVAAGI